MDENTIEINWEDAPEGTTHYDPNDENYPWIRFEDDKWYFFGEITLGWLYYHNVCMAEEVKHYIPKATQVANLKEQPYTTPKADPFAVSLKRCLTSQTNLEEYLESIYDKVDQGDEDVDVFVIDMTASLEKQGEDMLNFLAAKKEAEKEETLPVILEEDETLSIVKEKAKELFDKKADWAVKVEANLDLLKEGTTEVEDTLQKKDLNVSWYDYDKEELIGLPEKGEIVYDRHTQEDVEYLGWIFDGGILILGTTEGRCYQRHTTYIKPLNYKDSPKRQARKEQHKLLETLVGDVDSNLQGYTHKAGAIELYNKGWRVSKEDV